MGYFCKKLIQSLIKLGYQITRQKGSHIRLTASINEDVYHITIPNHNPIKIGTINKILKDVADHNKISKEELIDKLF